MKNLFLIIAVLFTGALRCIAAPDYNALWEKGNSFYGQKQYDSAASYLEQIAALKPRNADLYYNLGNTYYRLNKIALAVLNYERALHINPEYKDAKENLLMAQSRISNHIQATGDIFFMTWWQNITKAKNATSWAVSALITFTAIIVLMLLRRFQKRGNINIPIQIQGILITVFICLLALAFISAKNNLQNAGAVVMTADAPLMNSEQKGKPLMLLPEGTVVKITDDKGAWLEVRLPDGRTGWLQQDVITKI